MARYVRDEKLRDFQSKVRAEVERIGNLAKNGDYAIYVIHDPFEKDPREEHDEGLPVYVGQSKQLRSRANSHMRDGGGGSLDDSIKGDRLKQIMDKYGVPKFTVVDTAPRISRRSLPKPFGPVGTFGWATS
jgi:hypothetical protein